MRSLFRTRRPLLLITLVAAGGFAALRTLAVPTTRAAAAQASQGVAIYDSDPNHLWNRLHQALRAMVGGGPASDPWELDPFVHRDDEYVYDGEAQKNALAVLGEFLAKDGHTLVKDPLKRALLQRDLRTFFDSLSVRRLIAVQKGPRMELAVRLARIIARLRLTADEIKKLPDNYAEAVAVKAAWFLPTELRDPKGPWVLLDDAWHQPVALGHAQFFGGRSTFFVFMRLPGADGREQTLKFLDDLRKRVSPEPQFPSGTRLALMRQMQVIDEGGQLVTTDVTESLQLRGQGVFELKLNRRELFAGKPSLKLVGEDDLERDYLLFLGNNLGPGPSKVVKSCFHCHQGRGINSVLSYSRFRNFLRTPAATPDLIGGERKEVERSSWAWAASRYEWGLLQGLIQSGEKD
jgi:hypothetical protein